MDLLGLASIAGVSLAVIGIALTDCNAADVLDIQLGLFHIQMECTTYDNLFSCHFFYSSVTKQCAKCPFGSIIIYSTKSAFFVKITF